MDENRKKELDDQLQEVAKEKVPKRERDMMANCYIPVTRNIKNRFLRRLLTFIFDIRRKWRKMLNSLKS